MLLYGDPKVGKSYAALQLALALLGHDDQWLGFPVMKHGKVVYVQLDTPRSLWADRLEKLQADGFPISTLNFADRETLNTFPFDILQTEHFILLQSALREVEPIAVFIDTFRQSHGGDENDSTITTQVVEALAAATHPAAMILISHSRKSIMIPGQGKAKPDLINDNRGSSAIVGRMDAIVRFTDRSVWYHGRGIEEGSIRLDRLDNGFWAPIADDLDGALQAVINDPAYPSIRSKARRLSELTNKSDQACRSMLRRALSRAA